jgi:uncharacterized protein (UPF0332 family)
LPQWNGNVHFGRLHSAEKLADTDADSAASRAYYASFHAITALFALRGQNFSKHSAVRAAVHRELIQTGKWPVELGKAYDFLIDMRETGDYGGVAEVSRQDAEMCIEKASAIIGQVKDTCLELPPK